MVFGLRTAAWMHGLDLDPASPVQLVVPLDSSLRTCPGLSVRRCELSSQEIANVRGLRATSLLRTLRDICLQLPAIEALVSLDNTVRLGLCDRVDMWRYAQSVSGLPGSGRLRQLVPLAEPAESPMETRLRWLLIQSGLPRPQVQADLRDSYGKFVARADLYYPANRLVIEFDGGNHRDRLVADDRRQNQLINSGFAVLRFTSPDMHHRPEHVVAEVRQALDSARLAPDGRPAPWQKARLAPNGR